MIKRVFRKRLNEKLENDSYGFVQLPEVATTVEEAGLITSEIVDVLNKDTIHAPVLDIDFPVAVVPSTTPGKFHLYLDVVIEHRKYMKLLKALARAGVIEEGYAEASRSRGYTAVRLPWVQKPVVF